MCIRDRRSTTFIDRNLIGSKDKGAQAPLSCRCFEITDWIGEGVMAGNKISGFLAMIRRPSAKYSLLSLVVVGFFSGVILWGGFNYAVEETNTMEFCISCHEMHDNVYQEYKKTIHYMNRTGVRAICSDCHVPRDWTHKMIRKVQASQEIWGKLTGSISTPETVSYTHLSSRRAP